MKKHIKKHIKLIVAIVIIMVIILSGIIYLINKSSNSNSNSDGEAELNKNNLGTTEEICSQTMIETTTEPEITTTEEITSQKTTLEETTSQETTSDVITTEVIPNDTTPYTPSIKNQGDYIVVIDAGHQQYGNSEQEPIGPGASETKNKVAGGTSGVSTGIPEYELTLQVSLKLEQILKQRGYQVIMIRSTNNVNISNAERAIIANNAKADAFIRIHADASSTSSVTGMTALCQTSSNPYNGNIYAYSNSLSAYVINAMSILTGARNRGISETDIMSGINWSNVPTTIIEMGFMTNPNEDTLMSTEDYQNKLATGMANGIENYFAGLQ